MVDFSKPFVSSDIRRVYDAIMGLNDLGLLIQNFGNLKTQKFDIADVDLFKAALDAWYSDPANSNFIFISAQYIQDGNGKTSYLITYK